MLAVTRQPAVLDPDSVGTNITARLQLISNWYDNTVSTTPALTTLTRIPRGPSSCASARARASSAAFDAPTNP